MGKMMHGRGSITELKNIGDININQTDQTDQTTYQNFETVSTIFIFVTQIWVFLCF